MKINNILGDGIGYVELMRSGGDDLMIVNAARTSFNKESKIFDSFRDTKLIKYPWDHKHGTPFEMVEFWFRVKCPLFTARQWMRHRMGGFNEVSARYTEVADEYYLPSVWRKQHDKSKQCSTDETIVNMTRQNDTGSWEGTEWNIECLVQKQIEQSLLLYHDMINSGVAREQARMILPQCMYTEFVWKLNLRSLINFLDLRDDSHAQHEIALYAKAIKKLIQPIIPVTYDILWGDK